MRLELERDLDPFFSNFFEADYHHTHPLLPVFSSLLIYFQWHKRSIKFGQAMREILESVG